MTQIALVFGAQNVRLWVPDPLQVRAAYERHKEADPSHPFPHWARLWASSKAMAAFLVQNSHYIAGKNVLELAAGLGLPSLVAAAYARTVCSSDYLPEAVEVIGQSVVLNALENVSCRVIDWFHLPDGLQAEVLLLSDINYEPSAFEQLYLVIQQYLRTGTTVILTTPQRLMARPFIERLLPWCTHQEEVQVTDETPATFISILVLQL